MKKPVAQILANEETFLHELDRDPYPIYRAFREEGAIHWVEPLGMWYVVDYEHVNAVLLDAENFLVGGPNTLIYDTFGENMLTVDGPAQMRFRMAFRGAFSARSVHQSLSGKVEANVDRLIDSLDGADTIEMRAQFASRLPILTILDVFGLSHELEGAFRKWYDSFEAALSNFRWDNDIRKDAATCVSAFHELLQEQIESVRGKDAAGLLAAVVNSAGAPLADEDIRRNALIILFGGISTVEALLLNTTYAILKDPMLKASVLEDLTILPEIIEESVRWTSPVQSATRFTRRALTLGGVSIKEGDIVNCMLGAANRDPAMFREPDHFILGRENIRRHLGFAIGPHVCLGNNLARLEARIALEKLLARFPALSLKDPAKVDVRGYEFRQPRKLELRRGPETPLCV